jgi:hypothetical protein
LAEEYRAHAFVGAESSPYTHRSPLDMDDSAKVIQQHVKFYQQFGCVSDEIPV